MNGATPIRREHSLDLLRGLAAVSVIQIHTVFGSGVGYVPEWVRQISLMLDVPVFFFLAGWAQSFKPVSPRLLPGLLKLYVDYLIFGCAAVLFCMALGNNTWKDLVRVVTLQGFGTVNLPIAGASLWFVKVYLGCMLVFCLSGIVLRKQDVRTRLCAAAALIVVLASFLIFRQQGYVLFYLGFLVAGWAFARTGFRPHALALLAGLLVVMLVVHGTILSEQSLHERLFTFSKFPPDGFYLLMSLPSIGLCMFAHQWGWKNRALEWIGRNALWVYFAQGISGSIIYLLIPKTLPEGGWVAVWAGMFFINLVMALMISVLLRGAITPLRDVIVRALNESVEMLKIRIASRNRGLGARH